MQTLQSKPVIVYCTNGNESPVIGNVQIFLLKKTVFQYLQNNLWLNNGHLKPESC